MAADRQRGYSEVQIGEVKEEESDDFIIIDVDQCKQQQETPKETGGKTKTAEISSVDSGLDIDDYVEVSYNDVEQEVYIYNYIINVLYIYMSNVVCIYYLFVIREKQ